VGMDKQLEFFKKDEIDWEGGDKSYSDFYKHLFDLKHKNKALWNGEHGGKLVKIATGNDENVYAFTREKDGDKVVVIINLSSAKQKAKLEGADYVGDYMNVFSKGAMGLTEGMEMELAPWEYIVLSNK
ncbi:MAG: alpha-glucosidase C-terminal domain-containing protein, partial [Chitinophagales bacterium]